MYELLGYVSLIYFLKIISRFVMEKLNVNDVNAVTSDGKVCLYDEIIIIMNASFKLLYCPFLINGLIYILDWQNYLLYNFYTYL